MLFNNMDGLDIIASRIPDLDIEEARKINEKYEWFSTSFLERMETAKSKFERARGEGIKYDIVESVVGEVLPFMYPYFEGNNAFVFIPSFYVDKYQMWKNSPDLDKRIYCETIGEYAPIHESIEICILDTKQKEKAHEYSCLLSYLCLANSQKIKPYKHASPNFQIPFPDSLINRDIQQVIKQNSIPPIVGIAYSFYVLEGEKLENIGDETFQSVVKTL